MAKGSAARSSHTASGTGKAAHSRVSATRSGFDTPQIVAVTRGSRIENWSATGPGGTPCRAQTASTARTGASIASVASW